MKEIIQNSVKKTVKFKTVVHFKNGSKETVFHAQAPSPDGVMRFMHFPISETQFVGFNVDDVRKFETTAFVENEVNLLGVK